MGNKLILLTAFGFLAATAPATAGFRDPMGSSGARAVDLQIGPRAAQPATPALAPNRSQASSAAEANDPGKAARAPASTVQSLYGPLPSNAKIPARSLKNRPSPVAGPSLGPIPKAPSLPGRLNLEIPGVHLPGNSSAAVDKDGRPVVMAPKDRTKLHDFSRRARMQLLPSRTYGDKPRSLEIASRFAEALHPYPHQRIRTPLHISLAKIHKISNPPAPIQYQNMVKRLDALFDGFYLHYPKGIAALYELSKAKENPRELQARDALFAGILSRRAGWETVAGNLMEASAQKQVDKAPRYLGILWNELDQFETLHQIDRVVASVNPARAQKQDLVGDKANYAMVRRLTTHPQKGVPVTAFEQKIEKPYYHERLEIMRDVAELRQKDGKKTEALASLGKIEAEGQPELQGEARLALARGLLQVGRAQESLDMYRRVVKDGTNRLSVLGEQSYAEYRSGLYQDSLGKAMGLESPYFQYGFAPDIHLTEIVSRKAMCDFGGAEAGIQRFQARYAPELAALNKVLAMKADPQAFYGQLISYHDEQEPMRFQRYLLHLSAVMENQKVLNQAREELTKVSELGTRQHTVERPSGWTEFSLAMDKSWSAEAKAMKAESAKAALAEAEYMTGRLRQIFAQIELLGLDVATGASKNFNLQSALNFPVRKLASEKIDDEKFHWPFEDEIWEDELDFLKMKNPSKCASVATARAVQ